MTSWWYFPSSQTLATGFQELLVNMTLETEGLRDSAQGAEEGTANSPPCTDPNCLPICSVQPPLHQGSEHRPFGVPWRSRKDGNWSRAEPWFPCSPWWCSGSLTSQVHVCKEHEQPCLLKIGPEPYGQHTWHMVGRCRYWLSQVSTVRPVPSASSGKMTKSLVFPVIEQHKAATAMGKRTPVHSVEP